MSRSVGKTRVSETSLSRVHGRATKILELATAVQYPSGSTVFPNRNSVISSPVERRKTGGGSNSKMFLFSPRNPGEMIQFGSFFSNGLVQPPTRKKFCWFEISLVRLKLEGCKSLVIYRKNNCAVASVCRGNKSC